jgi:hypothetical protein
MIDRLGMTDDIWNGLMPQRLCRTTASWIAVTNEERARLMVVLKATVQAVQKSRQKPAG